MAETNPLGKIQAELQEGIRLPKCRKCGCMKETLENLQASLSSLQVEASSDVLANDEEIIVEKIKELSLKVGSFCGSEQSGKTTKPIQVLRVPTIRAKEPARLEMDKGGYFVILPRPEERDIIVEHYTY